MEFLSKIWDKIKSFFNNKASVVDQAAIDEARAARLQELNDPEDEFDNDVAYDAAELEKLSRQAAQKRTFRSAYYIFGSILAVGLVAWGLIGLLTTPKPDISIMIQADGLVEDADVATIRTLVADAVGDRNGDGKVVVEITEISMPAVRNEETEAAFLAGAQSIEETLVAPNIALFFGREAFMDSVNGSTQLADERLALGDLAPDLSENNPLNDYFVAYRQGDSKQAIVAKDVYQKLS